MLFHNVADVKRVYVCGSLLFSIVHGFVRLVRLIEWICVSPVCGGDSEKRGRKSTKSMSVCMHVSNVFISYAKEEFADKA